MSTPGPQAPAGWYPDPEHTANPWVNTAHAPQRYWDGTAWTDQTRLPPPKAPEPAGAISDSAFVKFWLWVCGIGVAALAAMHFLP